MSSGIRPFLKNNDNMTEDEKNLCAELFEDISDSYFNGEIERPTETSDPLPPIRYWLDTIGELYKMIISEEYSDDSDEWQNATSQIEMRSLIVSILKVFTDLYDLESTQLFPIFNGPGYGKEVAAIYDNSKTPASAVLQIEYRDLKRKIEARKTKIEEARKDLADIQVRPEQAAKNDYYENDIPWLVDFIKSNYRDLDREEQRLQQMESRMKSSEK